ncbi:MAG: HEAT repeat domain-containing protein [Acidobacteria bacterium]|nr:HEAT repeat domain-containing protein [Acidobacteriota bacterium]
MAWASETESPDDQLRAILDAVGTAWTTYSLYPNPGEQPAFARALDVLQALETPFTIGIGPGTFLNEDGEPTPTREGAERLARELFVHDVEFLRFDPAVTSLSLIDFFGVIATHDDEVRSQGGAHSVVRGLGIEGIEVFERGLLSFVDGDGDPASEEEHDDGAYSTLSVPAAAAAQRGEDPIDVATAVLGSKDDPAGEFIGGIEELHATAWPLAERPKAMIATLRQGDVDVWKGFRTFIESFFFLPHAIQLEVMERALERLSDERHQVFLDQFTGAELSAFLPDLSEGGRGLLLKYAELASFDSSAAPADLLEGLESSRDVEAARMAVAARVSAVVADASKDGVADTLLALQSEMRIALDYGELARATLRALLECEYRDDRFHRVVRVWGARVVRMIRDSTLDEAQLYVSAVLADPPFARERAGIVHEGVAKILSPETLRLMIATHGGSSPTEEALDLFEQFGVSAVDPLVRQLAVEDDGQVRRAITEMLASAANRNPRVLDDYLVNQPWYVIRNLAIVLGKTDRDAAVPGLRRLLAHDEHRVRVEVLRSLVRLMRSGAAPILIRSLADDNERVRQTAVSLLRSSDAPNLDGLLVDELARQRVKQEVAIQLIKILGTFNTDVARDSLRRLAAKRFSFSSQVRALKHAARESLEVS